MTAVISPELIVTAGQRTREPLDFLQELFGGSVKGYEPTRPSGVPLKGRAWRWLCTGKARQKAALSEMCPYLIVKRGQVELALEWLSLAPGSRWGVTPELTERRQALADEIRRLKRPWEAAL
jgi:hypothetical protein